MQSVCLVRPGLARTRGGPYTDPMAAPEFNSFHAPDGTRLHARAWQPVGPARGTVLLVHGLGEHAGRYEHVAQRLVARGYAVVGYDHRGHGSSEGERGALQQPLDLICDLAAVVDELRARRVGPLALLGHSMGGLVAARFVARNVRPVDALVLSSPALDPGLSAFNHALLAVSHLLAPGAQVPNGLDVNGVSRDPGVVEAYRKDPLVHDRVTPRLVRFIVDAGRYVLERAPHWSVPTLLMWAGQDKLVAPGGSARFAEAAPAGVVQAHCFAHMYHEILNEPDRDQVFGVLEPWLDARFPR